MRSPAPYLPASALAMTLALAGSLAAGTSLPGGGPVPPHADLMCDGPGGTNSYCTFYCVAGNRLFVEVFGSGQLHAHVDCGGGHAHCDGMDHCIAADWVEHNGFGECEAYGTVYYLRCWDEWDPLS